MTKSDSNIEQSKPFNESLPVVLTQDEIRHRGEALAAALSKITEIDSTLQVAKERAKGAKEPVNKEIAKLTRQIRSRKEDRSVECITVKDFRQHCAETIRQDTGEVVRTRPLTAQEMQTKMKVTILPGQGKAPAAPGKPA